MHLSKRNNPNRRMLRLVVLSLALIGSLLALAPEEVLAKDLHWDRYDVIIDLHQDGTFTVTEDQLIDFTSGTFSEGFATIPLSRVTEITNVQVFENGQPYQLGRGEPGTYDVSTFGGNIEILWWFTPATDETRQFTIQYDVIGGLRVYDATNRDQLWWRVIDSDFGAVVEESTATLNLPSPVPFDDLAATWFVTGSSDPVVEIPDESTIVWFDPGPIDAGDAFEIRAEFPKITTATAPEWQAADDARRAEEERLAPYKAAANILFIAAGLGILVAGPVGIYALWNTRGRDYPVELPVDVIREPPDDLSPGAVGVLIDERADDHDVIAMIADLAERGVLHIEEEVSRVIGVSGNRTWKIHRTGVDVPLPKSEEALMDALFGSSDEDVVDLKEIRSRFSGAQSRIKEALYEEVYEHGYFASNPETTRRIWRGIGIATIVLSAIVGCVAVVLVVAAYSHLLND